MLCCCAATGALAVDEDSLLVSLSYEQTELALENEPDVDVRGLVLVLFDSFKGANAVSTSTAELRRLSLNMFAL
jgi:hypothetical protein